RSRGVTRVTPIAARVSRENREESWRYSPGRSARSVRPPAEPLDAELVEHLLLAATPFQLRLSGAAGGGDLVALHLLEGLGERVTRGRDLLRHFGQRLHKLAAPFDKRLGISGIG